MDSHEEEEEERLIVKNCHIIPPVRKREYRKEVVYGPLKKTLKTF